MVGGIDWIGSCSGVGIESWGLRGFISFGWVWLPCLLSIIAFYPVICLPSFSLASLCFDCKALVVLSFLFTFVDWSFHFWCCFLIAVT